MKTSRKLLILVPAVLLAGAAVAVFALRSPGPSIMIITNASGPTSGGAEIVITGDGFTTKGHTRVLVGNVEATDINIVSPKTILVKVPPAEPGTVSVTVINPDGRQASVAEAFTYSSLKPVISSIMPDSGPVAGGFTVTLHGRGFRASDVRVKVDTVTVSPAVESDTVLTFIAPAMSEAKQVNVSVVSSDGVWASDKANLNYR